MKTQTCLLVGLLVYVMAFPASAQAGGPGPLLTDTRINLHHNQYARQRNGPIPSLAEGYWVREDNIRHTGPVVVRYYDGYNRIIQTDTLRQKRLNLTRRVVVSQLNGRLTELLLQRRLRLAISQPTP